MASSRRTYDTDSITLRTVFAKNPGNSNIPALRVLTADGLGGAYWAIPSSLGLNPSFNEIITSAGTYTADLSYNKFRLLAGEGIGMVNGSAGSNQTTLYAKAFSQLDISGGNSVYAFLNNQLDPTVTFAGENGIQLRADPGTNTFYIGGTGNSNTMVSTGIYGFSQVKVTDVTSSITSSVQELAGTYITATSPSTLLRFLGLNDIQLSTNVTTNSVFFTISTFTSQGYLNISNAAFSAYPNALSTVSSLYVPTIVFESTIASLSSSSLQWSSVQSSINALAMSTGAEFYKLSGLINARATIVQLNANIAQVNSNIVSTTQGLGSAGYISTSSGGGGGISALPYISSYNVSTGFLTASSINLLDTYTNEINRMTVSGQTLLLNGAFVSGGSGGGGGGVTKITAGSNISISPAGGTGNVTINAINPSVYDSISTVEGLGSSGYLSSLSVITTSTIFNTGAISTYSLEVFGPATLTASGSTILRGAIYLAGPTYFAGSITSASNTLVFTTNLTSSMEGLGSSGYISTSQLLSTTSGLQREFTTAGFLSSLNLLSTVAGLGTAGYISTAGGAGNVTTGDLLSTVVGLGTAGYTSTAGGVGNVTTDDLRSTVTGLGFSGYLSTPSLTSTTTGLQREFNTAGFLSTSALTSTTSGLQLSLLSTTGGLQYEFTTAGFLSTSALTSTTTGLQREFTTAGFLSTLSLTSTTTGLQREFTTAGFLSTLSLTSTTTGLQREFTTAGFLSTLSLTSTTTGLQREFTTAGFLSTATILSTVKGLGSVGYLSSPNALNISTGFITTSTVNFLDTYTNEINRMTVSSQTLLLNGQFITGGAGAGGGGGVTQLLAGTNITLSPAGGTGVVTVNSAGVTPTNLVSTTTGLQKEFNTAGFISSLNLLSTTGGLQTSLVSTTTGLQKEFNTAGFISSLNLLSTTGGLQTSLLSTTGGIFTNDASNFTSTAKGLGNLQYISSAQLLSTVGGLQTSLLSTTGGIFTNDASNFTSTVKGLGTLEYISSAQLLSTTGGLRREFNTAGFLSTSVLTSTVAGLGSARYISSLSLTSSLVSTTSGLEIFVSTSIQAIPYVYAGASVYMNYSVTAGSYKALQSVLLNSAGQSNTSTLTGPTLNNFFGGFQSDFALPKNIPAGIWNMTLFCEANSLAIQTYPSIYLRSAGGVETLVTSLSNAPITAPQTKTPLPIPIPMPQTTIPVGDTLVVKIFANNTAAPSKSFTTYFEDSTYSYIQTNFGVIADASILQSTVAGLGTAGYISSPQLISTVQGLGSGGLTLGSLVSTVGGLGSIGYASTQSGSLYISSLYLGGLGGTPASQLTTDTTATNIYWSTQQLAKASADIVVSTLGNEALTLFPEDLGKYFLFTENYANYSVSLPTPLIKGWNVVIKNMEASIENFSVVTSTVNAALLAPGVVTTILCDGLTYYAL